jgi:8-oxo-dGTP pyrophosphatase MutT (NUDIX family)
MGISPYLRRLRELIGHELLVLPSVAVLVWDAGGRLLLVRESQTGLWQTVGGAVEPDESPFDAAVREASEEAGIVVRITGIRSVVGGPRFRLTYPNGDRVSYVSTVFDAYVLDGMPHAADDETVEVGWFAPADLARIALSDFTVALFEAVDVHGAASA